MLGRVVGFVLLAMASAAPATAERQQLAPATETAKETAAVQRAIERGTLIYAYDQAAWHGTDDMIARLKAQGSYDAVTPLVGGWVVEGPVSAPLLSFFDKDPQQPHLLYSATMMRYGRSVASAALVAPSEKRPVTATQLALIRALERARQAFSSSGSSLCAPKPPNTVVLPSEVSGEPTSVYFLTPQTANGRWPMGGHYRVDVPADGSALSVRPFAKSCVELGPGGSADKVRGLFVTHLLDPVPTEIHVFTMLTSGLRVMVGTVTTNRVWALSAEGGEPRAQLMGSTATPATK